MCGLLGSVEAEIHRAAVASGETPVVRVMCRREFFYSLGVFGVGRPNALYFFFDALPSCPFASFAGAIDAHLAAQMMEPLCLAECGLLQLGDCLC